jgi:hypothetical protein
VILKNTHHRTKQSPLIVHEFITLALYCFTMKKYCTAAFITTIAIILISWGGTGHKTVAKIAENHLTANAKADVQALLGSESMADVASWADQLRNDPNYSNTGSWHYINAPLGLSYEEFSKTVKAQGPANVYGALLKCEDDLKSQTTTAQQKTDALKFIIHFVGDMHQPMHVSRAEDKGGNSIQLQFDGKGTNLHSLWDSGLINKQGETFEQMATGYDKATPKEIKDWQSTDPMQWAYESYEISTKLYAEADKDKNPGDAYYQQYIPIVQQRIEMAGIRLSGVLNEIFKNVHIKTTTVTLTAPPPTNTTITTATATATGPAPTIRIEDIAQHMNETVKICAKVTDHKDIGSMVLVNMGGTYPNQLLTVVFRGDTKKLAESIDNTTICITGKLIDYKGKPEIVVTESSQIGK